jgi:hypothetical protein
MSSGGSPVGRSKLNSMFVLVVSVAILAVVLGGFAFDLCIDGRFTLRSVAKRSFFPFCDLSRPNDFEFPTVDLGMLVDLLSATMFGTELEVRPRLVPKFQIPSWLLLTE